MKKLFKLPLLMFVLLLAAGSVAAKPIKALIVTGQNNHNWQVSHKVLAGMLENSGLFTVDVAISPAQGGDMSAFNPQFKEYDVVVLDYNGDRWNPETDQAFLEYAQGGGGVVVYHAADNAFAGWEEFNKITALGGWENREKEAGPYVYWRDGIVFKDRVSTGPGGSHGAQHEYVLNRRNDKHPITRGLPDKWLHAKDELYDHMRGPGNIKDVLFTAYSDPATGGSGREEILIFTVNYGKARVFHTMLGHAGDSPENSPALNCPGFRTTFLRGAQWAARGWVTQKVPADFPAAE